MERRRTIEKNNKQNKINTPHISNNNRLPNPMNNRQNKVNHPHDKIFRILLEDKTQVAELLNRQLELKEKIKPQDLEIYNSSFIDEKFRNQESDIVYKKKKQQIYFLLEHQSKIDYSMPRRILRYQIAIMEMAMKNKRTMKKEEKIPLVIPIVIYTGTGKWNVTRNIKDCQEQLSGVDNMDLGSYLILDNNEYTKQELLQDKLFILKMMALERTKDPDELYNILEKIIQKKMEKTNAEILLRITRHIYSAVLGEERTKDILEKIRNGDEDMIIEVLKKDREQQWKNGRQEGEKIGEARGKKIGIAKAITQMVKEMLRKQMNDNDIMEIARIDKEELEKLKTA